MRRRLVIVESPLSGDVERNTMYARACMRDCIDRGESPLASHLLYTQVLDDTIPAERELGMDCGFAWQRVAHACVVYVDLGLSPGMNAGIAKAKEIALPIEYRTLKSINLPKEENVMGAYVNPGNGVSKEEFLTTHGIPVTEQEVLAFNFNGPLLPVVLADNGAFTAAGIAYDARERDAFLVPDARPKKYYLVNKGLLHGVCPELQDYLDRASS